MLNVEMADKTSLEILQEIGLTKMELDRLEKLYSEVLLKEEYQFAHKGAK